jgi:hypothetical protein
MPVEHLWQGLREDVTDHTCYDKPSDLTGQVVGFEQRINTEPLTIADRLWVKTHLKLEEEELRVSS